MSNQILEWANWLGVPVALAHIAYHRSLMSDIVASRFDTGGHPNDGSDRDTYMYVYVGTIVVMVLLFTNIARLTRRLPNHLINLPHRDYWLAPDRRADTFERISRIMGWMGLGNVIFVIALFDTIFRANRSRAHLEMGGEGWFLAGFYLVWMTVLVARYLREFGRPEASGRPT